MQKNPKTIHIIGGGLAGSECALQLADRGYSVVLYEMRQGLETTPAHKTKDLAELVCSNSFGNLGTLSAPGQLKWEARGLNSHILDCGIQNRVPAGQALGMDREKFAQAITEKVKSRSNIKIIPKAISSLDEVPRPAVIATGPLTHEPLAKSMMDFFGDKFLYFFDAIAPIVDADSINTFIAWKQDRWDKGTPDYLNCPLDKNQYFNLVNAIKAARKVEAKDFEKDIPYFESCLPVEVLAERGDLTLRFGPMSAKGLRDPRTAHRPFAVVQLRQDNKEGTAYNMVGFQTKMAYGEQTRVFRMIPGLEKAEFLKLGSIHRNLYINSTKRLNPDLSAKADPDLYFAGQITGVEGYFDSTSTGLYVALNLDRKLRGLDPLPPPRETALGSLIHAITGEEKEQFQPTNINFGLFPVPEEAKNIRDKKEKKEFQLMKAKAAFLNWRTELGLEDSSIELPEVLLNQIPQVAVGASL